MKRVLTFLAVVIFAAACAGNKNILNTKMAKYPASKYITKIASADKKAAAKEAAAADLKAIFNGLPPYESSDIRRAGILSQVKAVEWWKDKASGKYYAVAALQRAGAQETMAPYYGPIDGKLGALKQRIETAPDKYSRLRAAMDMEPLLKQREQLDSEYKILAFDASAYEEDELYAFKAAYNKAFYDIKFNAVITGVDDEAVKTLLIDSLNSMGFYVGEGLTNYDVELQIKTGVDKYPSKTTDGLFWCTGTAVIALKDMQTQGIFATFTQYERIGASRAEEAQRRSLLAVGANSAPVIKQKLLEYVNKK
ncbi:MAG: hypothetical protein LBR90_00080 [Elusimicrobiota bacterium]|nr:hypothetical protein [Elusimicrobiota bacterium]